MTNHQSGGVEGVAQQAVFNNVSPLNGSINKQDAAPATQPADRENTETMLESMERYTHHLEGLIHRKNEEIRLLQSNMALHVEEEIQKVKLNERVRIHQARQAAKGELLCVVAHKWRQPLNVISLIVQNMKMVWEVGEFDGEFLDRSVSQSMEQIALMSRIINDRQNLLKSADDDSSQFDPGIRQCRQTVQRINAMKENN